MLASFGGVTGFFDSFIRFSMVSLIISCACSYVGAMSEKIVDRLPLSLQYQGVVPTRLTTQYAILVDDSSLYSKLPCASEGSLVPSPSMLPECKFAAQAQRGPK